MNPLANLNGKIMPLDEVTISPLDRGFLFGDAVYEVLHYNGRPWLEQNASIASSAASARFTFKVLTSSMRETHARDDQGRRLRRIDLLLCGVTRDARAQHAFPRAFALEIALGAGSIPSSYRPLCETGCSVVTFPDLRWHQRGHQVDESLGNVPPINPRAKPDAPRPLVSAGRLLTEASHSTFFVVRTSSFTTRFEGQRAAIDHARARSSSRTWRISKWSNATCAETSYEIPTRCSWSARPASAADHQRLDDWHVKGGQPGL